ncbi:hypothetical protein RvY_04639 [Ramazzottius varieornatus]|uniref:Uncharacterized protein n=1 Tax=Ramazzottius varieornatus TaxID=947166 RepID=A0A1D1USB1_RAMVA|nr:hypothetical protein RvY_04639 [Ramazzottius varieornatus]
MAANYQGKFCGRNKAAGDLARCDTELLHVGIFQPAHLETPVPHAKKAESADAHVLESQVGPCACAVKTDNTIVDKRQNRPKSR